MSKLSLSFSPCPNDTFIFDALVHHKIDTEGIDFDVHMADVEELNRLAFKVKPDITKLSYHAYAYAADKYILLNAGSALGKNCGPVLIGKKPYDFNQIDNLKIAIPGKYTTANFLLSVFAPYAENKREMLFSEIENAVLNETVDLGLIIHENRFTYQEKGLLKIADMGELWEESTGLPIPLGGIAVKRDLPLEVQYKIDELVAKSVRYAFEHPDSAKAYIAQHAQEMDEEVMQRHIDLYVNGYSIDLGEKGRAAIEFLFEKATTLNLIPEQDKAIILQKQYS